MSVRRAIGTVGVLACACALATAPLEAQVAFSLSPSVARGDDDRFTFGARYDLSAKNDGTAHLELFPWFSWFALEAKGTYLHRAASSTDPLIDLNGDAGAQILVSHWGRGTGYVVLGARIAGEADQRFEEAFTTLGGALQYAPPPRFSAFGVGFLLPRLTLEYGATIPVRSAIRDALGADAETYRRLAIEADWTLRLARTGFPTALHPVRIDLHLAHYRHENVEAAVEDSIGASGRFLGATLGYEFTGRVDWIRHAFVRWSEGEHAALPVGRRNVLVGITLAPMTPR